MTCGSSRGVEVGEEEDEARKREAAGVGGAERIRKSEFWGDLGLRPNYVMWAEIYREAKLIHTGLSWKGPK